MIVDYDNLHRKWDTVHQEYHSPTYQLRKKIILTIFSDLLKEGKNKDQDFTVLDVGCGTGEYSIYLAEKGLTVTGIDFSEYAVKTAQDKCTGMQNGTANFFVGDISTFTTTRKFNLIVLSEVLEHIDDDIAIVKKFAGFLKTDGHILLSVPFDNALWSSEDVLAGHVRRYDHQRIHSLLENAGLHKVKSICYGFPMLKLMWMIKIRLLRTRVLSNRQKMKTKTPGLIRNLSKIMVSIDSHFPTNSQGVGIIVLAKNNQ